MRNNKGKRNKATTQDKHDIVDVATDIIQAQASNIKYICKECEGSQLREYPQAQLYNPHAGRSYICPTCNKVYDSSLEKLPKAVKKVRSNVASAEESTPFIEIINENGGIREEQDEYDKYNPEPNEEEQLKAEGATIIESKITLTDSQGHNRTIVKRNVS
jgi:hypothetical protein